MNLADPVALPLPDFVQIEPVGQCNLACRMCPVAYREEGSAPGAGRVRRPAFMDFDAFCRLLDQFPHIRELQLQGLGEPLLHPRFFDMVRHAADRGIEVSTNSNLTALSERRAEECVRSGLHRLHVSLDAAEREAYEYIRVGAHFSQVLRNLGWLVEAKRRLEAELPAIELVAVAMRRNLGQLAALVRLAHEYGVRKVSVQRLCHDFSESTLPDKYRPMRVFVDGETLAGEDAARIERCFSQARDEAEALGIELRLPPTRARPAAEAREGKEQRLRCDWPWRGAYISFTGQAMPCCMVGTPDRVNFGNMDKEGVVRVWNKDAFREFRERLASDDPPEICRGCAVYNGTF